MVSNEVFFGRAMPRNKMPKIHFAAHIQGWRGQVERVIEDKYTEVMEEPVFTRGGRLHYEKETRGVLTGPTNTALFRVHDGGTGTGNGAWEQISPILHHEGDSVEMWPGSRRRLVHGRPKQE